MAKQTLSAVPALKYLINKGVNIVFAVIREEDEELRKICVKNGITYGNEEDLWTVVDTLRIDWLLSFYWKRIGRELLKLPVRGSINFHPGPLPEARGSGYHVAILENWGYWGVTAHYMDEQFDTGEIIECDRFPIADSIINKELVILAHRKAFELFKKIVDQLIDGIIPKATPQENGKYYSHKDIEASKHINEEDDSEQINRKIRAFWNPPYTGATINIKGEEYTLINKKILEYIASQSTNDNSTGGDCE